MLKKICFILFIVFATFLFASSEYDKDIVVKNLTRTEKIRAVFEAMIQTYEEEDIEGFFSFVSEDRFEQDYMTFFDAIDEDMRIYDILSVETYENKISEDGIKRILNIQWTKRYESARPVRLNQRDLDVSNRYEIVQNGTTDFTFDEINGKYKLIKIAGNNFWGGSLSEWKEEVGDIAGQSSKEVAGDNVNGVSSGGSGGSLPDLIVSSVSCGSSSCTISIENIGNKDINEVIQLSYNNPMMWGTLTDITCLNSLQAGDSSSCNFLIDVVYGAPATYEVNRGHELWIEESTYGNNCWQGNCPHD